MLNALNSHFSRFSFVFCKQSILDIYIIFLINYYGLVYQKIGHHQIIIQFFKKNWAATALFFKFNCLLIIEKPFPIFSLVIEQQQRSCRTYGSSFSAYLTNRLITKYSFFLCAAAKAGKAITSFCSCRTHM